MYENTTPDQAKVDQQIADKLIEIAADLLTKGSEATAGLSSLLRELQEIDPVGFEAAHARATLIRLGMPVTAH